MSALSSIVTASPWIPVIAAFVGAIVATFLAWLYGHLKSRKERRRKATGFLRGIDAEVDYAKRHAREYVEGKNGERVLAPAYRLLTRFTVEGTPWLAGEGPLERREIESLVEQLAASEELNRCLDEVAERANERRRESAGSGADDSAIEYQTIEFLKTSAAVNRAGVKARNICTGDSARGTANDAQKAIKAAAARARLTLAD